MSLDQDDIKKIADLAKLNLSDEDSALFSQQLSKILHFIEQMDNVNTDNLPPIAHSLDSVQRVRPDVVTETDEREAFQKIAPETAAGLYLVPQVIE